MVRRSTPSSKRWVAKQCLLCLERHSRHYVPFLTMSGNCSRAQFFGPMHAAGEDIVLTHSTSPVPEGTESTVRGIFGCQLVLKRASKDPHAGHIGRLARSLSKQEYARDSILRQALCALRLDHKRVSATQTHLESATTTEEKALAKTSLPLGRRGHYKPRARLLDFLNSLQRARN